MLNIISGLVRPTAGRILFGDRDVTDLPTEERNIAQVFQFPVLYDSMTVYDNLAFPLRNRGVDHRAIARRVDEVSDMLGLIHVIRKKAAGLSAADKQKISLGRGLVREDVAAILFDEPLTVIDPSVKYDLRRKIKMIHEATGRTLIYVTHDQTEAMTFADTVVVMSEGEVVQMGSPQDLYERPSHTFVGSFIGSPGINLLPCVVEEDAARFNGGSLALPPRLAQAIPNGQKLALGVRPRGIRPARTGEPGVSAQVGAVARRGASRLVDAMVGDSRLRMDIPDGQPVPEGAFSLVFDPSMTLLYANDRLVGAFDA
jgi:glycerol transport system ATP-binding protein